MATTEPRSPGRPQGCYLDLAFLWTLATHLKFWDAEGPGKVLAPPCLKPGSQSGSGSQRCRCFWQGCHKFIMGKVWEVCVCAGRMRPFTLQCVQGYFLTPVPNSIWDWGLVH